MTISMKTGHDQVLSREATEPSMHPLLTLHRDLLPTSTGSTARGWPRKADTQPEQRISVLCPLESRFRFPGGRRSLGASPSLDHAAQQTPGGRPALSSSSCTPSSLGPHLPLFQRTSALHSPQPPLEPGSASLSGLLLIVTARAPMPSWWIASSLL